MNNAAVSTALLTTVAAILGSIGGIIGGYNAHKTRQVSEIATLITAYADFTKTQSDELERLRAQLKDAEVRIAHLESELGKLRRLRESI